MKIQQRRNGESLAASDGSSEKTAREKDRHESILHDQAMFEDDGLPDCLALLYPGIAILSEAFRARFLSGGRRWWWVSDNNQRLWRA